MNTNNNKITNAEILTVKEFDTLSGLKLDETKIRKIYNGFGDDFIDFSDAPIEPEKFDKLAILVNNNAKAYCAATDIIKAYEILDSQIQLLNKYYYGWKNYFGMNFNCKSMEAFEIGDFNMDALIELLKHLLKKKTSAAAITGKNLYAVKYGIRDLSTVYVPVELYNSLTTILESIIILQEEYEKV